MIGKFKRRCAGATLFAVDDDEVGIDLRLNHRLANGEQFPGVSDTELEARRLAAGQPSQGGNELHHLDRLRECRVPRWRHAIDASWNATRQGDLRANLSCRQHPAVSGLSALAQLQLDHFHLIILRGLLEFSGAEGAVSVAATKIAR